jgi:glycosyltransferase involved in cell wall biosynthesis
MLPEVSVVVAVKNGADSLQRCLDSIAAQCEVSRETIVIDGGSTDGTRDLLDANARGGTITAFVSEPDGGLYEALNKGVRRSRGDWICFVGCDDAFHDASALRTILDAARGPQASRIVYGRLNLVTPRGAVAETVGMPWARARPRFLAGLMLPHPGTLHHRTLFEEHGLFDESYRIAGDYELLLRELRTRDALFVERVVVDMRVRGVSARPETIHRALREVARARAAHGLAGTPARLRVLLVTSWIGARFHAALGDRAFALAADLYRAARGKPRIWTV